MKSSTIVLKRGKRGEKSAKGGGAWKVAFADFTLAMMALFMVMWILEISNTKQRAEIANYMRTNSLFDGVHSPFDQQNSPYPVDLGGNPALLDEFNNAEQPAENLQPGVSLHLEIPSGEDVPKAGKGEAINSLINGQFDSPSQLSLLTQVIEQVAGKLMAQEHIQIEETPYGLRVIIRDHGKRQMFQRGQVSLTPFFEDLLLNLGKIFYKVQNKVIISGHTDDTAYVGRTYSNWNLSGERAQMARQVLTAGGMPIDRVAQVTAFSSTRPLSPEDSSSSENRRVELLILTTEAEQQLNAVFSYQQPQSAMNQAIRDAHANQPVFRSQQ